MQEILSHGYIALFIIIAFGMIIGRIKIFNFSLDISAVIFVALLLGHFGFLVSDDFMKVGLLLFIFTIGIQAGPGFFEAFKKYGRALIVTTLIALFSAALASLAITKAFNIDPNLSIGILNGALTSTPGLAAAIESTNSPLAPVGYGIAYTFGVVGVIILVNLLPAIFRIDLKKEEIKFEEGLKEDNPELIGKSLKVENPNVDNKKIFDLHLSQMADVVISKKLENNLVSPITKDTILNIGDIVRVIGTRESIEKAKLIIGDECDFEFPVTQATEAEWILVTNKKIINKRYSEIGLGKNYNATVIRIRRSGIEIPPKPSSIFRFGDKLRVTGDHSSLNMAKKLLGNNTKKLSHTDFLPIALGVLLGIALGFINIPIGGFTFNLGMTGGTLAAGIALSRLGKTGPIIWSMSGEANQLLRELGLLLFMAAVGTKAGATFLDTVHDYGYSLIIISVVLTIVPVLTGALAGHFIFKINFLTLLGVITGAMTSTPGLAVVNAKSDTNAAPIAYATVYPVALVFIIIISQVLPRL
ncbi:MAG: aspartate:alanine exchanger family transporter [Bacteroidales bacterium]|nr:aspartate:alanine exchanger family transporter [Bacteroidales bacterium]